MRARLFRGLAAALVLSSFHVGCSPSVSDGDDDTTSPTPTPTPTPEPGIHLTTDTTWTGAFDMLDDTIVDLGATLTIASNSTITVATGKALKVYGHLEIPGVVVNTASTPTLFQPATGQWNGILVRSGGTATLRNIELRSASVGVRTDAGAGLTKVISAKMTSVGAPLSFAGGGKACRVRIDGTDGPVNANGGSVMLADGDYRDGSGDRILFSGNGSLALDHIIVGGTAEHCLIHGDGASLTVTKSILQNGVYSFMVSNLANAALHFNVIDAAGGLTISSGTSTVNATENYWGQASFPGAPPAGWDVSNPVPNATDARVVDAGPRAWGAGCEVDAGF